MPWTSELAQLPTPAMATRILPLSGRLALTRPARRGVRSGGRGSVVPLGGRLGARGAASAGPPRVPGRPRPAPTVRPAGPPARGGTPSRPPGWGRMAGGLVFTPGSPPFFPGCRGGSFRGSDPRGGCCSPLGGAGHRGARPGQAVDQKKAGAQLNDPVGRDGGGSSAVLASVGGHRPAAPSGLQAGPGRVERAERDGRERTSVSVSASSARSHGAPALSAVPGSPVPASTLLRFDISLRYIER